jgi:hypothetical protein
MTPSCSSIGGVGVGVADLAGWVCAAANCELITAAKIKPAAVANNVIFRIAFINYFKASLIAR